MRFVNESDDKVTVFGLAISCAPGETCEVPDGYARPTRAMNGDRRHSILEGLVGEVPDKERPGKMTCRLKPVDPEERAKWLKVPEAPSKLPAPKEATQADLVRQGVPEGVAEQVVKNRAAKHYQQPPALQAQQQLRRRGAE